MSESVSIKIKVAGRSYPITVSENDQSLIQEIASELDSTVSALQSNYAVSDKQDLLAMAALQVATKRALKSKNVAAPSTDIDLEKDIKALCERSNSLV